MPTYNADAPVFSDLAERALAVAGVTITTLSGAAFGRFRTALISQTANQVIKDEGGVVLAVQSQGLWDINQNGKIRLELEGARAPGY
jgi:hypothetical protein